MIATIRMFDSNGDGYLSWPDVEKGIRVLGISQARALATGFSEVDGSRVLTDQVRDRGVSCVCSVKSHQSPAQPPPFLTASAPAKEYDYMSKEERKWLERHSRVFLLHDFDFYQKWRCTYAWADKKMVPNSEFENSTTAASTTTGPPSHKISPYARRRELKDGLDGHRPAAWRDFGGGDPGLAERAL